MLTYSFSGMQTMIELNPSSPLAAHSPTKKAEKWAEKERIIAKMEAETERKLVRNEKLEQWLDEAVKHTVHPEIEVMTGNELMAFVNVEVKQYRAEKRALEAIQVSH